MQVVSAVSDLDLTVVVDHDAEPVDIDQAVAKFLLALVVRRQREAEQRRVEGRQK